MKRVFDILGSLTALLLAGPLLLAVAVVVRLRMGSPLVFRQIRPGLLGIPFEMLKFRSMLNAVGPDGAMLADCERLTGLGRFLRASSLDELPSLWSVLKGDMSLVGPRPLLMDYLPLYSAQQARRHEVRPGITGWAQVNGRNALSWADKFALDVWYVDNQSARLDAQILWMTVKKVIARDGISADGESTMSLFKGN
jgi:lipopolysaccharide/colanic/teichoic acid biosynthesis glycosyltransferase